MSAGFFPQSKGLGIDRGECSTALLDKIVYAGTMGRSFEQASRDMQKLAEAAVPSEEAAKATSEPEEGAEAVLQLRADPLSADEPLAEFRQSQQATPT